MPRRAIRRTAQVSVTALNLITLSIFYFLDFAGPDDLPALKWNWLTLLLDLSFSDLLFSPVKHDSFHEKCTFAC